MKELAYLCRRRMEAFVGDAVRHTKVGDSNRQQNSRGVEKVVSTVTQLVQLDARAKVFTIPELLGMVFEYCISEEDLPRDNAQSAPLLLTRVCRSWRDIALATPRLWARLCLVCFPSAGCRALADRHLNVLSDWFARSGNCSTSLALRYLGFSASDVYNISKILDVTRPHSQRWRELSVTAPMPCLRPILQLLGHGTQALETCRITITSANSPLEREDLVVYLDNSVAFRLSAITLDLVDARKLKHLNLMTDALTDIICVSLPSSLETLSLNNFDLLFGPTLDLNFRCANLRKLTLRSHIEVSLLRQLAQVFPLLEDMFLNMKNGMSSESLSVLNCGSITFPKLQKLTLRAVSTSGDADLLALGVCLEVLHLPVLMHLSLNISYAILQRRWLPLTEHLTRVRPPLRELIVFGVCFTEDDFLAILREAPQLECLKICVRLTDAGLATLTLRERRRHGADIPDSDRGLCPKLRHLDIPLASSCSARPVIDMILSRWSSSPPTDRIKDTPAVSKKAGLSRSTLEECRLIFSESGIVEEIEQHPEIALCMECGLKLDLRAF